MIDVAFTRAALRPADVAVVIDVLRATSTATQALATGYRSVLCADSVQRARVMRVPGRALAGEVNSVMPAGFDLDNSPVEATRLYGEELVLATTNGAPTIVAAAAQAPIVQLACLLNLQATIDALPDGDVQIVCSGDRDEVALEDVYVAGRISARLRGPRTDAARTAEAVASAYPSPLAAFDASAHGRFLADAGLDDDVAYCARESSLDVVPRVAATHPGVAIVVDHANASPDDAGAGLTRAIRS